MMRQRNLLFILFSLLFSHAVAQDSLTIAMTGDIMMGTTFPEVALPANDGANLFNDVKHLLRKADIAVGNLEGTLCDGGTSAKGEGPNIYAFRTPTSYAPLLKDAGYDFLSMANNHAHDFGDEGINSISNMLVGVGDEEPVYYNLQGQKLNGRPTQRGIYIVGGKKITVK